MIFSFFAIQEGSVNFVTVAVATIFRDLSLVMLIIFFLWRNNEPLSAIGYRFEHLGREILIGVILFIPVFFGAAYLEEILKRIGFTVPSTPLPADIVSKGAGELILATILVVIVAWSEETIFRGYLVLRLKSVTQSILSAILLSSFIFSLGHGYEGSAGVVTVGVMGAVFTIIYLWRKSLVAPMVMHFLQDFIGIVVVSLIGPKSLHIFGIS